MWHKSRPSSDTDTPTDPGDDALVLRKVALKVWQRALVDALSAERLCEPNFLLFGGSLAGAEDDLLLKSFLRKKGRGILLDVYSDNTGFVPGLANKS